MKFVAAVLTASWIGFGLPQIVTDSPQLINLLQRMQHRSFGGTGTQKGLQRAREIGKLQDPLPPDEHFPCSLAGTRSLVKPTSVHRLRPGDIDVIAALGDSYTSGHQMAATTISTSALGNRGLSWAAGGYGDWRTFLTLPNILKVFNPNLIGYSYGDSFVNEWDAQFNLAEPGAQAKDMEYMAKILVKRIHADKRVDFKNDWKLVTLMIGGNDVCSDLCYLPKDEMERSPETYRSNLFLALDYLRDHLPRTIVSIVSSPNVEFAVSVEDQLPRACNISLRMECSCIYGSARASRRSDVKRIQKNWYRVEKEVANDSRYKTKQDFTVVLQPFIQESNTARHKNGTVDLGVLTIECLHLSQKGNARMANSMWNNLLEPVGKKSRSWVNIWEKFLCPSKEHPYIYTWKNSFNGHQQKQWKGRRKAGMRKMGEIYNGLVAKG